MSAQALATPMNFLVWHLIMNGRNRLKRWTLPMTLTLNSFLVVLLIYLGLSALVVEPCVILCRHWKCRRKIQSSDRIVAIQEWYETCVGDKVANLPSSDFSRVSGSFLWRTVSSSPWQTIVDRSRSYIRWHHAYWEWVRIVLNCGHFCGSRLVSDSELSDAISFMTVSV